MLVARPKVSNVCIVINWGIIHIVLRFFYVGIRMSENLPIIFICTTNGGCMENIFIIDDRVESKIDFSDIIGGAKEPANKSHAEVALAIAGSAMLASIPGYMFGTMVGLGAIKTFNAIYDKKNISKSEADSINAEIKALQDSMKKYHVTRSEAFDRGYKFPPGHPQTGVLYKIHPLAKYESSDKENVYIPESDYSKVLLDEREAELLRLLVDLGATKISISRVLNEKKRVEVSSQINIDVASSVSGDAKANYHSSVNNEEQNVRTFILRGKEWFIDEKVDNNKYSWLFYEPSWRSVVNAREVGMCLSAAIEISELSVYSKDVSLGLEIKHRALKASASGAYSDQEDSYANYIVNVEFSDPKTSAK